MDSLDLQRTRIASDYSRMMEHDKWIKLIPPLHFQKDWEVMIMPPFAGAMVRFFIRKGNKKISVYLDCYETLGLYGGIPYWEFYNGETVADRYDMNDTESLLTDIHTFLG